MWPIPIKIAPLFLILILSNSCNSKPNIDSLYTHTWILKWRDQNKSFTETISLYMEGTYKYKLTEEDKTISVTGKWRFVSFDKKTFPYVTAKIELDRNLHFKQYDIEDRNGLIFYGKLCYEGYDSAICFVPEY